VRKYISGSITHGDILSCVGAVYGRIDRGFFFSLRTRIILNSLHKHMFCKRKPLLCYGLQVDDDKSMTGGG
jgi:hypothetical protein